jgi:hypothetical protein
MTERQCHGSIQTKPFFIRVLTFDFYGTNFLQTLLIPREGASISADRRNMIGIISKKLVWQKKRNLPVI